MSTPSETMRTATIHGALLDANSEIFLDASGSSEVAMIGRTRTRSRKIFAIPLAWSWSIAMTLPAARGSDSRIWLSWACACSRTAGSHSSSRDSAVRRRSPDSRLPMLSSKPWLCVEPSELLHSMRPPIRGK